MPPSRSPLLIRRAEPSDVPAMHAIRMSVRENVLRTPARVTEQDYLRLLERDGFAWVCELAGQPVGFAVGDRLRANVWALFVHPDFEGRGAGRRLHDALLDGFAAAGLERPWLTTEPGTRAERFYRRAGWQCAGTEASGELRFEIDCARRGQRDGDRGNCADLRDVENDSAP